MEIFHFKNIRLNTTFATERKKMQNVITSQGIVVKNKLSRPKRNLAYLEPKARNKQITLSVKPKTSKLNLDSDQQDIR